jgi:hypothetical protein
MPTTVLFSALCLEQPMANPVLKLTEAKIRDLPLGSGIWRDSECKGRFVIRHKTTRSYAVPTDLRRGGRHVKTSASASGAATA